MTWTCNRCFCRNDGTTETCGCGATKIEAHRERLIGSYKPAAPAGHHRFEVKEWATGDWFAAGVMHEDENWIMFEVLDGPCKYTSRQENRCNENVTWRRLPPAQTSTVTAYHGPCASAQHVNAPTAYPSAQFQDTQTSRETGITKQGRIVVGYDLSDGVSQTAYVEMVQRPDGTMTVTKSLVGPEAEAEIARRESEKRTSASPPGEVSTPTPNLDKCLRFGPRLVQKWFDDNKDPSGTHSWLLLCEARQAVEADIRAAVERATAQDKTRIAELEAEIRLRVGAHREIEDEKNKLRAELGIDNEESIFDFTRRMKKDRDAALAELSTAMGLKEEIVRLLKNSEAEVERLRGELAQAKAPKRCPADAMSDLEVCRRLEQAGYLAMVPVGANTTTEQNFAKRARAMAAKAREMFTPCEGKTGREERKPQVGDEVFVADVDCEMEPLEPLVVRKKMVLSTGRVQFCVDGSAMPRRYDGHGKTWWWSDPSKGAE